MALKKSELYSSLWKSCDELRGGMDASQYKDYVLVLLFVKYVSDKYAGDLNALIDVPQGGGFADMVAAKGDKEIGDRINKIIGRLADANDSLKGAINVADFNDEEKLGKGKEMVDRLTKLVAIFEGLDFGSNRAEGDDLLGDAYEYAVRFNRRHRRCGHLFQNRYKSILCQEDAYLLELVRYIHLNPLRAKLVVSMGELDRYEFCGHGIILGKHQKDWQDVDKLLGMFGKGTGNEWSASGALVGHWPAGSPAVGCSRGKNCARVESGAFPLTKH